MAPGSAVVGGAVVVGAAVGGGVVAAGVVGVAGADVAGAVVAGAVALGVAVPGVVVLGAAWVVVGVIVVGCPIFAEAGVVTVGVVAALAAPVEAAGAAGARPRASTPAVSKERAGRARAVDPCRIHPRDRSLYDGDDDEVVRSSRARAQPSGAAGHRAAPARTRPADPGAAPQGSPSHAYLFHGPAGTGKRGVARAFAAALLADGAARRGGRAERVARGTHPDLAWVTPSGAAEMLVADIEGPSWRLRRAPRSNRRAACS